MSESKWISADLEAAIRGSLLLGGLPRIRPVALRFSEIKVRVAQLTKKRVYDNTLGNALRRMVARGELRKRSRRQQTKYVLTIETTRQELRGFFSAAAEGMVRTAAPLGVLLREPLEPVAFGLSPGVGDELAEYLAE